MGDAIHGLIMKNNNIEHILTTDKDFGSMNAFIPIYPEQINALNLDKK